MAAGSSGGLTPRQQERVEQAVLALREHNGLDVSVLVGDLAVDDPAQFRPAAERLHAALGPERAPHAVLLVVAPGQRKVEVVTGPTARRRVPDRVAALAVLSMTTSFAGGDLTGGVVDALRQFGAAAGPGKPLPALEAGPGTDLEVAHH